MAYVPISFQQLAVPAGAVFLTPPAGAQFAIITVETAAVRWRDDGTAPTSTIGMLQAIGSTFTYFGNLAKIQFIQVAAGASLDITYYRN